MKFGAEGWNLDRNEEITYFYLVKREPAKVVARRVRLSASTVTTVVCKTMRRLCPQGYAAASGPQKVAQARQLFLEAMK